MKKPLRNNEARAKKTNCRLLADFFSFSSIGGKSRFFLAAPPLQTLGMDAQNRTHSIFASAYFLFLGQERTQHPEHPPTTAQPNHTSSQPPADPSFF